MPLVPSRLFPQSRFAAALPFMLAALISGGAASAQVAPATESPSVFAQPQGPVVLTIHGEIEASNSEGGVELDLDMIKSLGVAEIETSTIWTRQSSRFEGVPLATILKSVNATGTSVRLRALNDYAYDITIPELLDGDPILAFKMDEVALSARDKGPLWLIYPFDSDPKYQTEQHFVRAIWQLQNIEVLP